MFNLDGTDCVAITTLIMLGILKAMNIDTVVDSSIIMIVGFYFGFRIKEKINKKR